MAVHGRAFAVALALGGAAFVSACGGSGSGPAGSDRVKRGEYLVAIAACGDCHTPGTMLGKPQMEKVHSGGDVGFQIPGLGTFYPPNLRPDNDTDLGRWSEADIMKAIREGVRPDGRVLAPVMPWHWYGQMTDDDAAAVAAYLKSLPPIANKVPGPFGANEKPTAPYQIVVMPEAPGPAIPQ